MREKLFDTMWERVGIERDAAGLARAAQELAAIGAELEGCALDGADRAFNLTWHDWMNLQSQVDVSRAIAAAAAAREDSRGAHFRSDFPEAGPLEGSAFTSLAASGGDFQIQMKPVAFTRVKPGQSLLEDAAA